MTSVGPPVWISTPGDHGYEQLHSLYIHACGMSLTGVMLRSRRRVLPETTTTELNERDRLAENVRLTGSPPERGITGYAGVTRVHRIQIVGCELSTEDHVPKRHSALR